jgi:hypothetical protein
VRHGGRPRRRPQDAPQKPKSGAAEDAAQPLEAAPEIPAEVEPEVQVVVEIGGEPEPEPEPVTARAELAEPAAEPEPDAAEPAAAEPSPEPAAEPAPAPAPATAVAPEPAPATESDADTSGPAELAAASYVPVGAPPLGLSSALAVEFGRAIEASWASAEIEEHEEDLEPEPTPESDASRGEDAPELQVRLARVHLRTGALTLARVELEKLAGLKVLDAPSMLDLAEARWRTGDLAGAGVAAEAYLAGGGGEPLGFVIAAEAASLAGRPAEARRYGGRALERSHVGLDAYFAGITRHLTWPREAGVVPVVTAFPAALAAVDGERDTLEQAEARPKSEHSESSAIPPDSSGPPPQASIDEASAAPAPADATAPAELPPPAAPEDREAPPAAEPSAAASVPEAPTAPPPVVSEPSPVPDGLAEARVEVELGTAALGSGDVLTAGLHFGVALRLTPSLATAVLDAIGDRRGLPLELVRGDALRLLGRPNAAAEAYLSVVAELRSPTPPEPAPAEEPQAEPASEPQAEAEPAADVTSAVELPADLAAEPEPEPPIAEPEPPIAEPAEPELAAAEPPIEPEAEDAPAVEPQTTEPAPEPPTAEPEPPAPRELPPLRWEAPDDL